MSHFALIAVGAAAGFGSAFLGIGGGVIMVPALSLLFGYAIKRAIGTSLATIVPAALVGAVTHYIINSGNILFISALFIALGSLAGAKMGAIIVNRIHSRLLVVLFALLLFLIGLRQLGIVKLPTDALANVSLWPFLIVLGLLAGTTSALFGIGGGVVMVPCLSLFFGFDMHQAIATSLTVIVPTTLAGAFFHAGFDNINKDALPFLVPAALAGSVFGAILSNMVSSGSLQFVFGTVIIVFSARMLFRKDPREA